MEIPVNQLPPGDPRLVDAIVSQLKSKGIFDKFRKECLADVDTKPAFLNLRTRLDGQVKKFLGTQKWKNETNKNQLRESVRKNIQDSKILDSGVDAIVNQVVHPKIKPLILPVVEETVYNFLQIEKPKREVEENMFHMQPPLPYGQQPFYDVHGNPMPHPYPPYPPMYGDAPPHTNPYFAPYNQEEVKPFPAELKEETSESYHIDQKVEQPDQEKSVKEESTVAVAAPVSDSVLMETDVISSEDDDILAKVSPVSSKSGDAEKNVADPIKMDSDNAVDSFDSARKAADKISSAVQKMTIQEESSSKMECDTTDVSRKTPETSTQPVFDQQSLDSISSNTSGLSTTALEACAKPSTADVVDQSDGNTGEKSNKSGQSTPLIDETVFQPQSISSVDSDLWDSSNVERAKLGSLSFLPTSTGVDSSKYVEGVSPISADAQESLDASLKDIQPRQDKSKSSKDEKSDDSNSSASSSPSDHHFEAKNISDCAKKDYSTGEDSSASKDGRPSTSTAHTDEPNPENAKEKSKKSSDERLKEKRHHSHSSSKRDHDRKDSSKHRHRDSRKHSSEHRSHKSSSKSKSDDHSSHRDSKHKHHRKDYDDDDKDRKSDRSSHSSYRVSSSSSKSHTSHEKQERRSQEKSSHSRSHSKSHSHRTHSSSSKTTHSRSSTKSPTEHSTHDSKRSHYKKSSEKSKEEHSKNASSESHSRGKMDSEVKKTLTENKADCNSSKKDGVPTGLDKTKDKSKLQMPVKALKDDNMFEMHLSNKKKDAVLPKPNEKKPPVIPANNNEKLKSNETKLDLSLITSTTSATVLPIRSTTTPSKDATSKLSEKICCHEINKPKIIDQNNKENNSTTYVCNSEKLKEFIKSKKNTPPKVQSPQKDRDSNDEDVSKVKKKMKKKQKSIKKNLLEVTNCLPESPVPCPPVLKKVTIPLINLANVCGLDNYFEINDALNCKKNDQCTPLTPSKFTFPLSVKNYFNSSDDESDFEGFAAMSKERPKRKLRRAVKEKNDFPSSKLDKVSSISGKNDCPSSKLDKGSTISGKNDFPSSKLDKGSSISGKNDCPSSKLNKVSSISEKNDCPSSKLDKSSSISEKNDCPSSKLDKGSSISEKNDCPSSKLVKGSSISPSQLVVLCDSSDSSDMEVSLVEYCKKAKIANKTKKTVRPRVANFKGFDNLDDFDGFSCTDTKLNYYKSTCNSECLLAFEDDSLFSSDDDSGINTNILFSKRNCSSGVTFSSDSEAENGYQRTPILETTLSSYYKPISPLTSPLTQDAQQSCQSDSDTRKTLKKRKLSTSSSRDRSKRVKNYFPERIPVVEFVAMDTSTYSLLTPEDDRTSPKDYEIDLTGRDDSYSPLSPCSDSSGEELTVKNKRICRQHIVKETIGLR